MLSFRRVALVVVCLFVLLTPTLSATSVRVFVSSAGIDSGTCSRSAPCRGFAYAMGQVSPGGEVVALDTAGYGIVTITQSVSVYAAPGAVASIVGTGGPDLITINTGSSDDVILSNLYLNGSNGGNGIHVQSSGYLHVNGCTFTNFGGSVQANVTPSSDATAFVFFDNDRFINGGDGIDAAGSGTGTVYLSVSNCQFEHLAVALFVQDRVIASVHDSTMAGSNAGVYGNATQTNEVTLERVTIFVCAIGITCTLPSNIRLAYCTILDNSSGLLGTSIFGRIDGTSPTNTVEGPDFTTMPHTYSAK